MTNKLPCFEGIPHNVIYDVACLGSTNPAPRHDMGARNFGLVLTIFPTSLITVGEI